MGTFATGVTVVTTRGGEEQHAHGMTANAFSSVSLDPPPGSPRLVPERIDNAQSAQDRRGMRGVDSLGFAEVDPASRLGTVESGWRDEH